MKPRNTPERRSSYQLLDYTFLQSVHYPHAVINSCRRRSAALNESVALSEQEIFGASSFAECTVTDIVYLYILKDFLMQILQD
jgi:hypothetical protein